MKGKSIQTEVVAESPSLIKDLDGRSVLIIILVILIGWNQIISSPIGMLSNNNTNGVDVVVVVVKQNDQSLLPARYVNIVCKAMELRTEHRLEFDDDISHWWRC